MPTLKIPPNLRARGARAADRARRPERAARLRPPEIQSHPSAVAAAAVAYARLGLAVLPLHTIRDGACTCAAGVNCKSPGKHPLADGVHSATTDVAKVERLWRENPDANVGIATGKVSDLVVLDVDPRNGGFETSRRLADELGLLPRTVCSDTGGGGSHRLFRYPDVPCPTRHAPAGLSGLDVQSDGAFIVAPPSRHASGLRYRVARGSGSCFTASCRAAGELARAPPGNDSSTAGCQPTID